MRLYGSTVRTYHTTVPVRIILYNIYRYILYCTSCATFSYVRTHARRNHPRQVSRVMFRTDTVCTYTCNSEPRCLFFVYVRTYVRTTVPRGALERYQYRTYRYRTVRGGIQYPPLASRSLRYVVLYGTGNTYGERKKNPLALFATGTVWYYTVPVRYVVVPRLCCHAP